MSGPAHPIGPSHFDPEGAGHRGKEAQGVFTYRVDDDGKMVALRAFWELDQAETSAQRI